MKIKDITVIQNEIKSIKQSVTTPYLIRSIERLERLVNTMSDRDSVERFERNEPMSDYIEKIINQEKGHINDITKKDGEKFFVERVSSDIVRENKNLENLVHLKDQIIKDLYKDIESYRDTILDTDDKLSNLRKLLSTKDEQIGDLMIKNKSLQEYTTQRVPTPPSIEHLSKEIDGLKIRFDEIQDIVLVVNTILSGGSIGIPQGKSVEWTPEYRDIDTARSVITRNLKNLKNWDKIVDPSTTLKGFASPITNEIDECERIYYEAEDDSL